MTISLDGIECSQDFFLPIGNERCSDLEKSAEKVQTVWQRIWNWTISPFLTVWMAARSALGGVVRDLFFFPLKPYINSEQMKIEMRYYSDFWNPKSALDPNLADHLKVRENFAVRDEIMRIEFEGQEHAITCRIIESKAGVANAPLVFGAEPSSDNRQKSDPLDWYNFIFIPGNLTTIDNNVIGIYPFLSSYLALKDEQGTLPPARFITVTQYDIRSLGDDSSPEEYLPETLDQAAQILEKTISSIQKKYGPTDQLWTHSIGCVFFSAALKYLRAEAIPKSLVFHCGPSSLAEVGKNFWFGGLANRAAKLSGWSVDVADEIAAFRRKFNESKEFSLVVSGVKQDYYFSGKANLCSDPEILSLKEENLIDLLVFDPPIQFFHDRSHHNLPTDFLVPNYLSGLSNSDFIWKEGDQLAKVILRRSLPSFSEENPPVCSKKT